MAALLLMKAVAPAQGGGDEETTNAPAATLGNRIPLFERFPELERRIAYVALAELPTPIRSLSKLGGAIGAADLYVKDDGLSGRVYGGNKIRKLEFVLADALERGASEVVTFGFAGSNHAAATAVYARDVGLRATSLLLPQRNATYVRRNLLLGLSENAAVHEYPNVAWAATATAVRMLGSRLRGDRVYVIPPGGSSVRGVLGYLNAALELDGQIARGELPEPDRIYVALGSGGTVAGLLVGLALTRRTRTRVVAVRVAGARWASTEHVRRLFARTVAWLRALSPSLPPLALPATQLQVRDDCVGPGYACFTRAGADAVALARAHERLALECTYTGKALAALVADARSRKLGGGPVLFWNTHNTRDLTGRIAHADFTALPRRLRRYFEADVQELDPERATNAEGVTS